MSTAVKTKPRVLVLFGDGINCEKETAQAFALAGFQPEIRHLNDLIAERMNNTVLQREYKVVALPGGFSFGDDLGSGQVLALKIQYGLGWDLNQFAQAGGMVIGICNGFQALLKLGVFGQGISITHNVQGKFMNTWVRINPQGNRSVWLKGAGPIDVPIRHGEGRIVIARDRHKEVMSKLERTEMMCLRYEGDPNGSEMQIAGLSDSTGRILGLMPHPEAFVRWTAHPEWTMAPGRASGPGQGLLLFQNAYREVTQNA